LPTRPCNRASGLRGSTAGSLVHPGRGGGAVWPSAGSDRCSGLTSITTFSTMCSGRMPMMTFGPMPTTTFITASTAPTPMAAPGPAIAAGPDVGIRARGANTTDRPVASAGGSQQRAAEVCSNGASDLTDWPIERISEVVQSTEAQRPALDELRAASQQAIDILKAGCPRDLPSTPTGRLAAMESRVKVMLQALQTVRPPLERLYQLLSDEQKARLNAVSPGGKSVAEEDQRALTKFCREQAPAVTDLPFDRIAQATQPTSAQRFALDELKVISANAAQSLKANCPIYAAVTPTGRIEAMEKRLEATHGAALAVQPALTKFYDGLSDGRKAGFNS